jgi:hypothetical protein
MVEQDIREDSGDTPRQSQIERSRHQAAEFHME